MREKYVRMKELNDHLLKQLETDQQEVDRLTMKKAELEDVNQKEGLPQIFNHSFFNWFFSCFSQELAMSPVKQEAGLFRT